MNTLGECVGDDKTSISDCGNSSVFETVMASYMENIPADPGHNHDCGIGGGDDCKNNNDNRYYSYDPTHICPAGAGSSCATLCFHRSESGEYTCGPPDNPVCDSGANMNQNSAHYCIVFVVY